jgi:hypothetical protein
MEKLNRRDFMKTVTGALVGTTLHGVSSENVEAMEFPTKESIADTIEALLAGMEATTTQMFEDEQGIIACTLEFALDDGETATLEYMRKGRHEVMKGSNSLRTNIYVTYFDGGFPVGGTNVAEFKNGKWQVDKDALE